MNMKMKWIACLAALALLASFLVGCSASSGMDGEALSPGDSNSSAGGVGGAPSEEVKPETTVGEFDRKIIRTVTMSCESMAYDDAITVIMTALNTYDGYVEASSSSGASTKARSQASTSSVEYSSGRYASYTLRIPAENLDAFLNDLRVDEGIRILSQNMSSDEITAEYYDTTTRLETLNAEKTALTAMLESFTDYKDISAMLQVQERLYDVMEEIDALQTQLKLYDSRVAMSTVYLDLREVVEYTVVEDPTFGERIREAFVSSWTAFGRGWQNFAVWFVSAFPTLLVLAAIAAAHVAVALCIVRICRKRRNARRNR